METKEHRKNCKTHTYYEVIFLDGSRTSIERKPGESMADCLRRTLRQQAYDIVSVRQFA